MTRVATQDEMQILARIVRGDSRKDIAQAFGITEAVVTNIKKRNPDTIKVMQEQILSHRISHASRILGKANLEIEQRLDESDQFDDKLEDLKRQHDDGELSDKEYQHRLRNLNKLTVADLTSISREMHSQTKTGDGDGTPNDPRVNQTYLVELAKALESGDEVVMERLIFNPKTQENANV